MMASLAEMDPGLGTGTAYNCFRFLRGPRVGNINLGTDPG